MPYLTAPTVPETIATTVATAPPMSIKAFPVSDIAFLVITIAALVAIVGFFFNRASTKRREDRDDAQERTQRIMDAVEKSRDDGTRDVRELTDKVKDGRTVIEKDIEAVRTNMRHEKAAREQSNIATAHLFEKQSDEITKLRDRMTAQETNSKHQTDALEKLETTVREKIDEMKDMIKAQGETALTQFRELSNSIREARDVKFKS